jgi:hypothetical protein
MSHTADVIAIIRDVAIVGALGYVIELMRQQIALLHQESSVKQAEIDTHKATIEHLAKFQAPAISRDLEQMTKTAENYAKQKADLERQVAVLAEQNASIDKLTRMAFNVGVAAGSYEAAAALTISIGWAHAFSALSGESKLSSSQSNIVDDLDRKLKHFGTLADQALRGEKVEFRFTHEVVRLYRTLADKQPSTNTAFYGETGIENK